MSTPALLSLQQTLRKCFQDLESDGKVWRGALAECSPLIESLGNLGEQLRALSDVQIANTPLRIFPQLEEKLRFKLHLEVDTVLGILSGKMSTLHSVMDATSNHVSGALQLYERNSSALDLPSVTQRSATSPSVVDMLEWLQDVERYYRQQYVRRRTLLQTLRADDLDVLQSVPKKWASMESRQAEDDIADILLKVSFFVEAER